MKHECAWCRKTMSSTELSTVTRENAVTHGICDDCLAFMKTNTPGRKVEDFLDMIHTPVMLVNADARVMLVNAKAREMLQQPAELIEGHLGGDVMECAYARLPGGCGKTEHCKACTIRQTVMATYNDGQSRSRITAVQNIMTPAGIREMQFIITTERQGLFVLLQINEVTVGSIVKSA